MKLIIDKYRNNIKKIISTMTGSDNEDIEQEVYIRTWKNIDKFNKSSGFKSWINTVTANLCRDYLKSAHYKNTRSSICDDEELIQIKDKKQNVEINFIQKQRQHRIIKAIDSLKPKLREVIVMYEIQEMSYETIAKKINCPIGTVRSRLFNARKELSILLKDLI